MCHQSQHSPETELPAQHITPFYAVFKHNLPNCIHSVLSRKEIHSILMKKVWTIKKKSNPKEWTVVWKWMQECLCERLLIESKVQNVLNEIEACKFSNLKVLNLSHNSISNIQPLTFIDAVNLEFIYLQTNHITSVKCLNKMVFRNLQQVDLSGNKFNQAVEIGRLKTNKLNPGFSIQLFLFTKSHHHHQFEEEENNKIQNISQMAKLEHFFHQSQQTMKYDMLKRQFQYLFFQSQTQITLTTAIPQFKQLYSLSRKFGW